MDPVWARIRWQVATRSVTIHKVQSHQSEPVDRQSAVWFRWSGNSRADTEVSAVLHRVESFHSDADQVLIRRVHGLQELIRFA
eukprot:3847523-Amphidinium_carterae.1